MNGAQIESPAIAVGSFWLKGHGNRDRANPDIHSNLSFCRFFDSLIHNSFCFFFDLPEFLHGSFFVFLTHVEICEL